MIRIELDDAELLTRLEALAERIEDNRPLMREIAGILLDSVEENFEHEGRPPWPDLAPATIAERERKGYWPGRILQRRGGGGGLAGSIQTDAGLDYAMVGTNKRYAAIHQLGGKAGRGRKVEIPARPFLGVTEEDMHAIYEAIDEWLRGA